MKHLNVLRTICTHEGDFRRATFLMHTGRADDGGGYQIPSIGTILAHELGRPDLPLPLHVAFDPPALPQANPFGERCLPVRFPGVTNPIPHVRRIVDIRRDLARTELLDRQNGDWNALRRQDEILRLEAAAADCEALMNTPLLKVFNFLEEQPELRDAYGDRFGIH